MSLTTRDDRPLATELKFVIDTPTADRVRHWAREHMTADPYAAGPAGDHYVTTTIYFDTTALDVFHRRGSFGRSKYRVRRYGVSDLMFLERKMRTRERLSKRRTLVPVEALSTLESGSLATGWAGAWFARRLETRALQPVCVIRYDRTARLAMSATGPVRLTVDQNLMAAPASQLGFADGQEMHDVLPSGTQVLELKFRVALPALFKRLLEQCGLQPDAFSKYRAAAARGLVNAPAEAFHA